MSSVVTYSRTSTDKQETGLQAQELALKKFCEAQGYLDVEHYSDFAISGTRSDRPELHRLLEKVELGEVKKVIVFSFSRMARSVTHLLQILDSSIRRVLSLCPSQNVLIHRQLAVERCSQYLLR